MNPDQFQSKETAVRFTDSPVPPASWRGGCLTIGNFDGVHLGHAALIAQVRQMAVRIGAPVIVMTFHPHPVTLLTGHLIPFIQTQEDRIEGLLARGADGVWLFPFNAEFASLSPREFVDRILVEKLGVGGVVVGPDFRFGARRAGTSEILAQFGQELGFLVEEMSQPVIVDGEIASSSRIRVLLQQGHLERVERLMGIPYQISGIVQHGAGLGRQLGFPTANLIPPEGLILPPAGVYAANISLADGSTREAAVSLGTRPTFDNGPLWVEAHVLDFQGDLYDSKIRIWLRHRIRSELRFDSPQQLIQAMHVDLADVRNWFAQNPLPIS